MQLPLPTIVENDRLRFGELLRRHQLKITMPRLHVLDLLSKKETATSQPELEKVLGKAIDRVTLYRILSNFEDKGILHKIFDLNGTATYALCSSTCPEHLHFEKHVHFTCSVCNGVYCLNSIKNPSIDLPAGFRLENMAINAVGVCSKCNEKK